MINITTAQQYLQAGKIIIYPTDTVYGLGCLPSKLDALNELLALKKRTRQFIVLIDDWERFKNWIDEPINTSKLEAPRTTWIFKASSKVPTKLTNVSGEVAIRKVVHNPTRRLIAGLSEPLVSTSANFPKQHTPTSANEVAKLFSYPILAGDNGSERPSTIIHYQSGEIIRH